MKQRYHKACGPESKGQLVILGPQDYKPEIEAAQVKGVKLL